MSGPVDRLAELEAMIHERNAQWYALREVYQAMLADPAVPGAYVRWLARALAQVTPTHQVRCTGIGASWCPVHGTCRCDEGETNDQCPLHGLDSRHAAAGEREIEGVGI